MSEKEYILDRNKKKKTIKNNKSIISSNISITRSLSNSSDSSVELVQNEDELKKIFMNVRNSLNFQNIMSIDNKEEYCDYLYSKRKNSISESEAYFGEKKMKRMSSFLKTSKKDKRRTYSNEREYGSKTYEVNGIKYVPYYISSPRIIDPYKSKIFFF